MLLSCYLDQNAGLVVVVIDLESKQMASRLDNFDVGQPRRPVYDECLEN